MTHFYNKSEYQPVYVGLGTRIALIVVIFSLLVVSLVCNVIVMVVTIVCKVMRQNGDWIVMNISLSNIMLAIIGFPISVLNIDQTLELFFLPEFCVAWLCSIGTTATVSSV